MAQLNWKQLITWVVRIVLAAVFLAAALPKILDPVAFATSIEGFRVVSGASVNWIALLLPWFELFIALGLLAPWLRQASTLAIGVLLIAFMALHISAWARGLDVSCGCFGKGSGKSNYALLLARNFSLFVGVLWLLWCDRPGKS